MTSTRPRQGPVALLAHGAGSDSGFLARAFPADDLGMAGCRYLDDRTGDVPTIMTELEARLDRVQGPVVLGGVSIGAHAAARLLARRPEQVVGGILCLPAWTGPVGPVASLTAVAAEAVADLGIETVLAGLPADDWVTRELASAWAGRSDEELAAELITAARQRGPTPAELQQIDVPVGLVSLSGDPLHPAAVSAQWASLIESSAVTVLSRSEPSGDLPAFARAARTALRTAFRNRDRTTPAPDRGSPI